MDTAEKRTGSASLSDTAFLQLVSSMVTSYDLTPEDAHIRADQALAAVATAAAKGGRFWLSVAVDQGVRLLMADPIRLAGVTQGHQARVRRLVMGWPGKPGDVEATVAAMAEVGFELHDAAWKDQQPAAAVLVCGQVLPQNAPTQV